MQRLIVHMVRAGVFASVVILIHLQQTRFDASRKAEAARFGVAMERVRTIFPDASSLGETTPDGTRDVQAHDGKRLGYVLQTAPESDDNIGFSGATNVMVGFGPDDEIAGIAILSSGDTDEHVGQIMQDESFREALIGREANDVPFTDIDAVSGATLTSVAMLESISERLGGHQPTSLRFPEPPTLEQVQHLFPDADKLEADANLSMLWHVVEAGQNVGRVLRTSPAADGVIGYQGPTLSLIGFDLEDQVIGLVIGQSFDNEPYVGYVREDYFFPESFNGQTLKDLAEMSLEAEGIEGVSGATMTSQAIAQSLQTAANTYLESVEKLQTQSSEPQTWSPSIRDYGTGIVVVLGLVIGMTSLRGRTWIRIPFLLVLVGYLGLTNGDMLSQALLVGWAKNGVPIRAVAGLFFLTVAAFVVPLFSKSNVYCTHLCPHGAAQQLLRNRLPWQWHLPKWLRRGLKIIPGLLLIWVVIVAMSQLEFSLVDIEPFDAYLWKIAGVATLVIAGVGLVASLFVPMAYCRYGCPTGALLGFLRFHRRSDQWTARDLVAGLCLLVALGLYLWR
ncbi:FMN-binding protein [Thalassoroseus pseudoceratinae]|uniref:FMN-binding protein n=1 Tax=Thalassoroseus pseudoceratinae TaxID=2713176 RepID=UPI001424256F|nr:FMN-binding protein [Thalassoroseus pseudoceratinae]